jgi:hypothetical protein
MDKVQKLSSKECYTPSSEPFRVQDIVVVLKWKMLFQHDGDIKHEEEYVRKWLKET